jgi:DNA-directed RNA polymerase specialized sigma24 family protein
VTDVAELLQAAEGADVRVGLRAAVALRRLAERLEALQVERARQQGWSWQQIADVLEVTRQAVHKRYARRP